MAGIINYFRMLFKPRRQRRFSVRSGTFVIVSPGTDQEQRVQLIDISRGGAAFIYQGSPEELRGIGRPENTHRGAGFGESEFRDGFRQSDPRIPASVGTLPAPGRQVQVVGRHGRIAVEGLHQRCRHHGITLRPPFPVPGFQGPFRVISLSRCFLKSNFRISSRTCSSMFTKFTPTVYLLGLPGAGLMRITSPYSWRIFAG